MITLPPKQTPSSDVLARMQEFRKHDARWQEGKTWSLVYYASDEVNALLKDAFTMFFSENALNPVAFPSLRRFETEVVAMTASLLGGDTNTVGNMTTGGTESLLLAVKTARDWARARDPDNHAPEMVLPESAHPAFEKAAHYFGVTSVRIPVGADFRASVPAALDAVTPRTILMIGSAPSYPQGVVDPIEELAQIAADRGILFHVDACVGGFMLPFVRRLGYTVPAFDFQVPGVTSLSVDLHKYGYAAKGASVILYRNPDIRRYQFSSFTDWPGGIYISPTMTGTRAAGPIAAAWAIMNHLGEEGYLAIAKTVMQATTEMRNGIGAIEDIHVLGDPAMSILAIGSDGVNIYEVADELTERGWHVDRQQYPASLHLTVTHAHAGIVDEFLRDLDEAVVAARRFSLGRLANSLTVGLVHRAAKVMPPGLMSRFTARSSSVTGIKGADVPKRSAAMYGMMASLPNRGDLNELVLDLLDQMTRPDGGPGCD